MSHSLHFANLPKQYCLEILGIHVTDLDTDVKLRAADVAQHYRYKYLRPYDMTIASRC